MTMQRVLSFALACLVMGGIVWVASVSFRSAEPNIPPRMPSREARAPVSPPVKRNASHIETLSILPADSAPRIMKCVVNGATVYSDAACPSGASGRRVDIAPVAGVVGLDQRVIEESLERGRLRKWVNEVPGRSATRTVTRNGKTETYAYENPLPSQPAAQSADPKHNCAYYAEHVRYLDGLARQPQSGSTQDRINEEKSRTQSAMYDAHCS